MDPLVVGGALAGIGSVVGGLFGSSGQSSANKTNLKIARESFAHNQKMWQLQNDYNSPVNQMARYREAGLNPHMMYGSVSSGNSTNVPEFDAPRMENAYQSLANGISGGFNTFSDTLFRAKQLDADLSVKNAQANRLNAEADAISGYRKNQANAYITLLGEQTNAQRVQSQYNLIRISREKFGHEMEQALRDITIGMETQKLRNLSVQERDMYSQMIARDVDNMLKRANISKIEFEKNLKSLYYQLDSRKQTFEESKEARRVYEWSQEYLLNKNRYKFDRWHKESDIKLKEYRTNTEMRTKRRDYWLFPFMR